MKGSSDNDVERESHYEQSIFLLCGIAAFTQVEKKVCFLLPPLLITPFFIQSGESCAPDSEKVRLDLGRTAIY